MVSIEACTPEILGSDVAWDPKIGSFVRVTYGAAGRILSRIDLDPQEKRAVLRCLVSKRTTREERLSACRALEALGLIVITTEGAAKECEGSAAVAALSARYTEARKRADVAAFATSLGVSITELLTLAWAINFAAADMGQPLPRLEDVDSDLPFIPPEGVDGATTDFDPMAALSAAELDCDEQGYSFRQ
jgi:hypothetical protein